MTRKTWLIAGVVAVVALVLPIGSVALLVGSDIPRWLVSMLVPQRGPKSSGPSVAWPTMVALAQQNEPNIHKDRVLKGVYAQPPGTFHGIKYTGPVTGSLEVTFEYDAPSSLFAWVRFEDASPASTLETTRYHYEDKLNDDWSYNYSKEREPDIRAAIANVKIAPREALALTWADAVKSAPQLGMTVEDMDPAVHLRFYDPDNPVWEIIYWPTKVGEKVKEPEDAFSSLMDPDSTLTWWLFFGVDAQTGRIVQFEVGDKVIIAPPTRTPKPR